jgi:hypothetical protein
LNGLPESTARLHRFSRTSVQVLPVLILNAALLWHFHDRYWYPTDDGFYANIAERLLNGEVLGRDIQDIHPGLIHFVHAAALRIFGVDLVSLRYPLFAAGLLQSLFVYLLLRRRGVLVAAAGSIASVALGVPQFFDPSPSWYCLALTVVLTWWLVEIRPGAARLLGAGVLVGTIIALRHLTGVWIAMAVIVIVLLEEGSIATSASKALARSLLGIMLAALLWYLLVTPDTQAGTVLLISLWPALILIWTIKNTQAPNPAVARAVGMLAIGVMVPLLPLLAYHLANQSMSVWLNDVVVSALGETDLELFGSDWYGLALLAGLYQAVSQPAPSLIANGLYWVVLTLAPAINGALAVYTLRAPNRSVPILPIVATFAAMVSAFYAGPLYLYYSVGFVLVSLLWMTTRVKRYASWPAIVMVGMGVIALAFHAGQSRHRTAVDILQGRIVSNVWTNDGRQTMERASLRIEQEDVQTYGSIVALIRREVADNESILALPNDAELYVLADRRNPTRFYNSAMIRSDADREALLRLFNESPPRLVLFRPGDKYMTRLVRDLMTQVKGRATLLTTIDGLEIYRTRSEPLTTPGSAPR